MSGQQFNFTNTNFFAGDLFAVNFYLDMLYTKKSWIYVKLNRIITLNVYSNKIQID